MDYRGLVERIDRADPESSLFLRKPSGRDEHEGGVKFEPDSDSYKHIKRWIEKGAQWNEGSGRVKTLTVEPPRVVFTHDAQPQQFTVTAEFWDGSREVVTHLCQFSNRDEGIAVVEPTGQVARIRHGDTSVIIAYGNAFASVSRGNSAWVDAIVSQEDVSR